MQTYIYIILRTTTYGRRDGCHLKTYTPRNIANSNYTFNTGDHDYESQLLLRVESAHVDVLLQLTATTRKGCVMAYIPNSVELLYTAAHVYTVHCIYV